MGDVNWFRVGVFVIFFNVYDNNNYWFIIFDNWFVFLKILYIYVLFIYKWCKLIR